MLPALAAPCARCSPRSKAPCTRCSLRSNVLTSPLFERPTWQDPNTKPLAEQRWAGVVDTVGGATLSAALAQTKYRGALACPGVASGGELNATVYPLILRGVRLMTRNDV